MPVEPSRFRWKRRGGVVVAGAGPAMNLALAIVALALMTIWIKVGPVQQPVYGHLTTFFFVGAILNLVLMAFNLLPVPPLDGSAILSGLSFRWYRLLNQTNAPMIGMFLVLALMLSGLTDYLWVGGFNATCGIGDLFGRVLGNPPVRDILAFAF
jgi:Zn-dependent protease